ncbi:hypothetical protein WJ971_17800 [Achromobacter xylosoxidans]
MANRSYLYSLSNRPASYADRPETICGLSEWPYAVPFSYRLLMSGDPQVCASLIADGLEDDEPHRRTRLYAISSRFEPGLARIKRFAEIVRAAVGGAAPATAATPAAEPAPSLLGRIRRLFSSADAAPAGPATTAPTELLAALDETIAFLEAHRDDYLLLETIELDVMAESEEAALKASVEKELARCRQAGARSTRCLPIRSRPAGSCWRPPGNAAPRRWMPCTDCAWTTASMAAATSAWTTSWG